MPTCPKCPAPLGADGRCLSDLCITNRPTPSDPLPAESGCVPATPSDVRSASGAYRFVMTPGTFTSEPAPRGWTPPPFHAVVPSAQSGSDSDAPPADPNTPSMGPDELADAGDEHEKTIPGGPPEFWEPLSSEPVATIPPPDTYDPDTPTEAPPDDADTLRPPPLDHRAGSGIRRAVQPGDDADAPDPKAGDGTG